MRAAAVAFAWIAVSSAAGQVAFEAASIKPSPPLDSSDGPIFVGPRGGPGTADPGRFTCSFCDLGILISQAYDVPEYRLSSAGQLTEDRFHIVAAVSGGATREQLRTMLRTLLAERFKLATHREQREMTALRLIVSSGGPKLKPHVEGAPRPLEDMPRARDRAPGIYYKTQGKTMAEFARFLEGQMRKPVTDATGLTGTYDFDIWWGISRSETDPPPADSPTMYSALESLGLKLESRKARVDVVVIDHVEKAPTEN